MKSKINNKQNPDGTTGAKEAPTADEVAKAKLDNTKFKSADAAKRELDAETKKAPLSADAKIEADIKAEEEAKVNAVADATSQEKIDADKAAAKAAEEAKAKAAAVEALK